MSVYKKVELVGTSKESVEDAINAAVVRASESVHSLGWFEVGEIRGRILGGAVTEYQVVLKVAFKIDREGPAGA